MVPSTKTDRTNQPIKESDILNIFKNSVFNKHLGKTTDGTDKLAKQDGKSIKYSGKKKDRSTTDEADFYGPCGFTTQLLLLYYVLLYQDTVVNNMKLIGM